MITIIKNVNILTVPEHDHMILNSGSKIYKMATSRSDLTSDEIINIKCCLCDGENRTRAAEQYCLQCHDYFCSSCVRIHTKIASMKGHQLLDKGDFGSLGPDGSLPSHPTQRCPLHQLKVVDLYCKEHDEVACASCIALSHRCCGKVVSIPEEIESLYQTINVNERKQKMSQSKKKMEEFKLIKETRIQALQEMLNTEIESVRAFRQELQALLEKMENETIQELTREFNRIEASLKKDVNEIEDLMSSTKDFTSQLKKSEGNKSQEFVCVKSSQKLTAKVEEAEKNQLLTIDETVSFMPNQSIKTSLQQDKTLGKVSINKHENVTETFTPKDSLYTVKNTREINVQLEKEKNTCSIWGSCLTDDGSLLLADIENKTLKRIDMCTEKIKDYVDLQSTPWAVCAISNTEAAVTLENMTVQFVFLGDKMKATRTIKFNHRCFGIAQDHERLFISDWNKTVYIYDMNGKEQSRVSSDGKGNAIFQCSMNIAVSYDGDKVFVTDLNNGLVVLNSQGNYVSTCRDKNVLYYQGVCIHKRNLFVSSQTSNNIVQFGHDFKMLGQLKEVKTPLSLCFDHRKLKLIATLLNNNNITILELE